MLAHEIEVVSLITCLQPTICVITPPITGPVKGIIIRPMVNRSAYFPRLVTYIMEQKT